MQTLLTRTEAAKKLGIGVSTLDTARYMGLISYIQYVPHGCVYFTEEMLDDYILANMHYAKIQNATIKTYRQPRFNKG